MELLWGTVSVKLFRNATSLIAFHIIQEVTHLVQTSNKLIRTDCVMFFWKCHHLFFFFNVITGFCKGKTIEIVFISLYSWLQIQCQKVNSQLPTLHIVGSQEHSCVCLRFPAWCFCSLMRSFDFALVQCFCIEFLLCARLFLSQHVYGKPDGQNLCVHKLMFLW